MHNFRSSTALCQLADFSDAPVRSAWCWAVVALEPSGRLLLPGEARIALNSQAGVSVEVSGVCHRDTFIVRGGGNGRRLTIDRRGRLYVPAWVRRGDIASLIVGTRNVDQTVVIIATSVLDHVGDDLIGGSR